MATDPICKIWKRISKSQILILLGLFIVALLPRLYGLSKTEVYPDEISWMVFGKELVYALVKGNWSYFSHAWWNDQTGTYAIGLPLTFLSGIFHIVFAGDGKYSLHFFSDIVASRLPLVIISSLFPALIYSFGHRFLSKPLALAAALAYSLNPVAIAVDRWVINDGYLTLFSFAAISFYLKAYADNKKSFLPGTFAALAFLTKPHGILVFIPWIYLTATAAKNKPRFFLLISNLITFLIVTFLLWPQSWRAPVFSLVEYIFRQTQLSNFGVMNYYLGRATTDPGWTYYIFQLIFKTPEIVAVSFFGSLILLVRSIKNKSLGKTNFHLVIAVALYFLTFFILVSANKTKTGVRYIAPLLPWIYLAAAWFWGIFSKFFHPTTRRLIFLLSLSLILFPLSYFPNYYSYYNLVIGGAAGAQKYDMVGLCLGDKAALEYLDSNNIAGKVAIVGCPDTGPYNTKRQLASVPEADLIIVESAYLQQHPESPLLNPTKGKQPLKSVVENGIITARIYQINHPNVQ